MIGTDAVIDGDALLSADMATKIAATVAWREHFNLSNSPSLRDEWARAFCRHALHYISTTTRPN